MPHFLLAQWSKTVLNFGHHGFKPFQEPDLTLLDFWRFLIFDDFWQKNRQPSNMNMNTLTVLTDIWHLWSAKFYNRTVTVTRIVFYFNIIKLKLMINDFYFYSIIIKIKIINLHSYIIIILFVSFREMYGEDAQVGSPINYNYNCKSLSN